MSLSVAGGHRCRGLAASALTYGCVDTHHADAARETVEEAKRSWELLRAGTQGSAELQCPALRPRLHQAVCLGYDRMSV